MKGRLMMEIGYLGLTDIARTCKVSVKTLWGMEKRGFFNGVRPIEWGENRFSTDTVKLAMVGIYSFLKKEYGAPRNIAKETARDLLNLRHQENMEPVLAVWERQDEVLSSITESTNWPIVDGKKVAAHISIAKEGEYMIQFSLVYTLRKIQEILSLGVKPVKPFVFDLLMEAKNQAA